MKRLIGILVTGSPPGALQPEFGTYDLMVRRRLGDEYAYRSFDVVGGELPDRPDACDAYVITGSAAGTYEPHPWIAPLEKFLRAARGRARLVGICFGHQIMAQAFGGSVERSPRGWGSGLHAYDVREGASWMDGVRSFAVPVSHQDQVVALPSGARVLAGSSFTPNGMLAYDDGLTISFQCHPEFEPAFAARLVAASTAWDMSRDEVELAVNSLSRPNDCARVGGWIAAFLDADARSLVEWGPVDATVAPCTLASRVAPVAEGLAVERIGEGRPGADTGR